MDARAEGQGMIPMIAKVRVRSENGSRFSLWVPLILVWIVALPFALIILPVLAGVLIARGIDVGKGLSAIFVLLCSLSGTLVEVESPGASVAVRIQ
jgi:hypothetical protein